MKLFAGFKEECGNFDGISCGELTKRFFLFFQNEREFVELLIANNMTRLLERQFEQYLPQISLFRRINETERYPDYSVAFVAGALTQTLIHWLQGGFQPEVTVIGALTEGIISGKTYRDAVKMTGQPEV